MGENLDLPGRMAVRTPMQWQPGEIGGFSTAETRRAVPAVSGGALRPGRGECRCAAP